MQLESTSLSVGLGYKKGYHFRLLLSEETHSG